MLTPLFKHIGGKRRLAPKIVEHFPRHIPYYIEPFCGGAAVFAELFNAGRVTRGLLCDANIDVIRVYNAVKNVPRDLLQALRLLSSEYMSRHTAGKKRMYYRVRDLWNEGEQSVPYFLFLKATAFNGLWRLNKDGKLNAAWGKYENPAICSKQIEDNVYAWHVALQEVTVVCRSALDLETVPFGSVVYCDPPYMETFTGYTAEGFSEDDQMKLLHRMEQWWAQGAFVAGSNSVALEPYLAMTPWETLLLSSSDTVSRTAEGRAKRDELFFYMDSPTRVVISNLRRAA